MLSRCESSSQAQEKQVQNISVIAAGRLHRRNFIKVWPRNALLAPQLRDTVTRKYPQEHR